MATEPSSSAPCGAHVSVAPRGECLSAAGGTFWRDYTQAPAVPSAGPLWQLSHPVSRFLNRGESPPQTNTDPLSVWNSKRRRKRQWWLQMFPIKLISSVGWSSRGYMFQGGISFGALWPPRNPRCLWIWKSLVNLLFHCIKVQRSSVFTLSLQ